MHIQNAYIPENDSQLQCQITFEQLQNEMIKKSSSLHQLQDNYALFEASIALQKQYECSDVVEKNNIFYQQILPRLEELILDKYNHFVIQCVFIIGPKNHKDLVTAHIFENIGKYWNKKYSYQVIQWALSEENCPEKPLIIEYILQNLQILAVDQFGNLIVSHIVQFISDEIIFAKFLHELQVLKLVLHQYGCLVVIKLVEFSRHNNQAIENQIIEMFDKLIDVSLDICYGKYSNYVIQKILIMGNIANKNKLLNNIVLPNFFHLAKNKFGSNVCEIALANALSYQLQNLWFQCLEYHFKSLVNDDYGNLLFINIENEFVKKIYDLNRLMKLNHNGRIVYTYVMISNQVVQTEIYEKQQQYFQGN